MKKALVSCIRIKDCKVFIPEAIPGDCSECAEKVWLAPSTVKLLSGEPLIRIVCIPCMSDVTNGKPVVFALAPGALSELVRFKRGVHNN